MLVIILFLNFIKIKFIYFLFLKLVSLDEAKMLLKQENNTSLNINDDLLKCIYDYWKEKRLKYVRNLK